MLNWVEHEISFITAGPGIIDQTPKKGILVVQGDWNAKVCKDDSGEIIADPTAMLRRMR